MCYIYAKLLIKLSLILFISFCWFIWIFVWVLKSRHRSKCIFEKYGICSKNIKNHSQFKEHIIIFGWVIMAWMLYTLTMILFFCWYSCLKYCLVHVRNHTKNDYTQWIKIHCQKHSSLTEFFKLFTKLKFIDLLYSILIERLFKFL